MKQNAIVGKIIEKYFIILFGAVILGVLFAEQVVKISSYGAFFLGVIFFVYALKVDIKKSGKYLQDRRMILVTNVFMLVVLPVVVYYATRLVYPEIAVAALILAAMPAGMTTPLLSEIVKGRPSLALVITITTSLFAPFTIPLVIKFVAGASVDLSVLEMFEKLARVIFIPIVLANVVKYFAAKQIKRAIPVFTIFSTFMLGVLIMVLAAKQADNLLSLLRGGKPLLYLGYVFVLFILFHLFGYYVAFWRSKVERTTIAIGLTYMDFALAIFLVDQFFPNQPEIVIPVLLSIIPWVVLLVPFRSVIRRLELTG